MKTFYTYLWLREDGTPYYVGKGTGKRAFQARRRIFNKPKDRTRIIIQEFETEQDAIDAEEFLISYYGRKDVGTGILRNASDGGRGERGHRVEKFPRTAEYRRKLSLALKGKRFSLAHCRNISIGQFNISPEIKAKKSSLIAKSNSKRVWGDDSREKISKHSTKDMAGLTFGGLFVLERGPNGGLAARWWCRCICGNLLLVRGSGLRHGQKSCGCLAWPQERRQKQAANNADRVWTQESRDKLWRNRLR